MISFVSPVGGVSLPIHATVVTFALTSRTNHMRMRAAFRKVHLDTIHATCIFM